MQKKQIVFYLLMFALVLAVIEIFGYATAYIFDDIYDHRAKVLPKLQNDAQAAGILKRLDPVTGWRYEGPKITKDCDCMGNPVVYSFDGDAARIYSGYDGRRATVVLVGDSYTHGSEVAADDTFAARLSQFMDTPVANLGVGGFGPVQAFLNLKQKLSRYPDAEIAILGIMYENIFRMVNSYRPVLADKSSPYRIKPYIRRGEIRQPGPEVLASTGAFADYAVTAFDHDFWSKPAHRFPYTLAYTRALTSNYFYHKRLARKLRKIGVPEYYLAYRSKQFSHDLIALMDQFATFARQHQVLPVVVFMPRDKYDTRSIARFIQRNSDSLPQDLLIVDVGSTDIDWDRYNLLEHKDPKNINICHPSPYGHQQIAASIFNALQERLRSEHG